MTNNSHNKPTPHSKLKLSKSEITQKMIDINKAIKEITEPRKDEKNYEIPNMPNVLKFINEHFNFVKVKCLLLTRNYEYINEEEIEIKNEDVIKLLTFAIMMEYTYEQALFLLEDKEIFGQL